MIYVGLIYVYHSAKDHARKNLGHKKFKWSDRIDPNKALPKVVK
jgi:hypothetical protein